MEPGKVINYLRGTADNLDSCIEGDPENAPDITLEASETSEVVSGLRDAADEVERMLRQVAAYQEWSKALADYIVATHKQGAVDDASAAILDGYHVGLTPVAGPRDGGENTLAAALRLLKLAKARGAFDPRPSKGGA